MIAALAALLTSLTVLWLRPRSEAAAPRLHPVRAEADRTRSTLPGRR